MSSTIEPTALYPGYRATEGLNAGEEFGFSVATIGDFDGDGANDYSVSSRKHMSPEAIDACSPCIGGDSTGGGRTAGRITIYAQGLGDPIALSGEDPRDSVGWAMTGVGDVDGDGKDEFVACAMRWGSNPAGPNQPEDEEGRVYLIDDSMFPTE